MKSIKNFFLNLLGFKTESVERDAEIDKIIDASSLSTKAAVDYVDKHKLVKSPEYQKEVSDYMFKVGDVDKSKQILDILQAADPKVGLTPEERQQVTELLNKEIQSVYIDPTTIGKQPETVLKEKRRKPRNKKKSLEVVVDKAIDVLETPKKKRYYGKRKVEATK